MATASQLIKILEREIGYRESGENNTKYNRWLGPISGYPHSGYGYPWCASFASWAYAQAGLRAGADFPRTASCAVGVSWYRARGRWGSTPRVGAQVYYGPGGGTHTEIVVAVSSSSITTIGGNTSGSLGGTYYNGDGVYKKSVARSESRIYGYGYPTGLDDDDLTSADIKEIARAVWDSDGVIEAPPERVAAGNTHWKGGSYLAETYRRITDIQARVRSAEGEVAIPAVADAGQVAAAVLAGLAPETVADSIPPAVAARVLELLRGRLAGGAS